MDISYIVPVYNALPYLKKTVASLVGQDYDPSKFELIFVDDGSTDGSGEYLDDVASQHGNMRVVHTQASGGPAHPRNVGIGLATGDYLFFCDADDWMELDATARMMARVREWGSNVLVVRAQGEGGRGLPYAVFDETIPSALPNGVVAQALGPCKLFKTSLVRDLGLSFDESLPVWEDQEFVARAYLGAKVLSVDADQVYCHWLLHEDEVGAGHVTEKRDTLPFEAPYAYLESMLALGSGADFDGGIAARALREGLYYAARSLARMESENARTAAFESLRVLVQPHVVDETWLWLNTHRSFLLEVLLDGSVRDLVELVSFEKAEFDKTVKASLDKPGRLEWTSASGMLYAIDAANQVTDSFQVASVVVSGDALQISGQFDASAVKQLKNGMLQIKKRGMSEVHRVPLDLRHEGDVIAWSAAVPIADVLEFEDSCFWDVRLRLNIADRRCFSGKVRVPEAALPGLSGSAAFVSLGSHDGAAPIPYRTKGGFLAFANMPGIRLVLSSESGKDRYRFEGVNATLLKNNPSLLLEASFGKKGPVCTFKDGKWHDCPVSPWKLGKKCFGMKLQAWTVCHYSDGRSERLSVPVMTN